MRRATADPRPKASTELGGALFDAVFGEEVLLAWTRSQDATREAGEGLRLRLQLTDAPEIAGLPWELLYDRRTDSYPAQSERTPLVRYLEVPHPPRPLTVDGPLRILVVLSSPTDLPELDVEAEWRRMQDMLGHPRGRPAPSSSTGCRHRRRPSSPRGCARHEVHVLHVVGPRRLRREPAGGRPLLLRPVRPQRRAVPPAVLGPYLHDHDPLRLVFLNACQSGRLGAADPFSGMAQRLVQQDCTAVVAMQFPISDGAATAFTGEFYAALADGMPVDQAVTSARKGLLAGYASEWATPVLYLNAPDGQVFDGVAPPDAGGDRHTGPGRACTRATGAAGPPRRRPPPRPSPAPVSRPGRGRLIGIAAAAAAVLVAVVVFAVTAGRVERVTRRRTGRRFQPVGAATSAPTPLRAASRRPVVATATASLPAGRGSAVLRPPAGHRTEHRRSRRRLAGDGPDRRRPARRREHRHRQGSLAARLGRRQPVPARPGRRPRGDHDERREPGPAVPGRRGDPPVRLVGGQRRRQQPQPGRRLALRRTQRRGRRRRRHRRLGRTFDVDAGRSAARRSRPQR